MEVWRCSVVNVENIETTCIVLCYGFEMMVTMLTFCLVKNRTIYNFMGRNMHFPFTVIAITFVNSTAMLLFPALLKQNQAIQERDISPSVSKSLCIPP